MKFLVTQVRTIEIESEHSGYAADLSRTLFAGMVPDDFILRHAHAKTRIKIERFDISPRNDI